MKSTSRVLPLPLPLLQPPPPAALRVVAGPPPATPPQPATRTRQAWLALRLPDWPLYAALHRMTPDQQESLLRHPVALMQEDRQRSVLGCDPLAFKRGIRPGHSLNAAIALCAELKFLSRDEPAEQRLLNELALECQAYTPTVVVLAPNELLLEVRGSLRLFGGSRRLLQLISARLRDRGIVSAMALSSTARSAQWLCRATSTMRMVPTKALPGVMSELPLYVLQWPAEVSQRLRRFGVTHLGDLMRLPRAGLARRIGKQLLDELDQALGRRPDLRCGLAAPLSYRDRILLDFEIETTTLAETVLNTRLARLQQFLTHRTLAISELAITLMHRDHPHTPVRIGLAAATANMAHVAKLLHETLASVQLPAPIREMIITADHLATPQFRSGDLAFNPLNATRDRNDLSAPARLLEQLRARLGREVIRGLGVAADHRPECTQLTFSAEAAGDRVDRTHPDTLPLRPLWLLPQPRLLPTIEDTLRSHALRRGPERIQGGWWDGNAVDRDYFVANSEIGSMWWVFQDRAHPADWYLHGLFA